MNWLSYFYGVITLPILFFLFLLGLIALYPTSSSLTTECTICTSAGFKNAYHDFERRPAFIVFFTQQYHRQVTARRKQHRIEWQKWFDSMSESSYRKQYLLKNEHRYGIK